MSGDSRIHVKNVRSALSVMFVTDTELFFVNGNHETCFNRNTKEIVTVFYGTNYLGKF